MHMSQLIPYSIGIAAENKPLDTRFLNVAPIELLSALDGEIKYDPQTSTVKGQDSLGNQYEIKTTLDNSLTAEWLPGMSNRVTPPDIRRGEFIELFRLADSDKFYWRCMGIRDDLRRLETAIYAFNGTPVETDEGIDYNTCYFFEVSTHKKLVTMSTSQANGEPFRYTFQFNTDEGHVLLTDDVGNHVLLDSANTNIHMENIEGTMVELNKKDINFYAPQDVNGLVDNDVNLDVGRDLNVNVGNNENWNVGVDRTTVVGANDTMTVGGNRTTTIGVNDTTTVGSNSTETVGMNITTTATAGEHVVTAGKSSVHTSAMAHTITAGAAVAISAGGAATVTGAVSAAISCGAMSLVATPAGLAMSGGATTMGMTAAGMEMTAPVVNMTVGQFNVKKG